LGTQPPQSSAEAHKAMRGDPAFNIYSAMRVQAQKMVWASVAESVEREAERLGAAARAAGGKVALNPTLDVPKNVGAIEVHLMPGSYTRGGDSLEAGAVYDRGLAVFSMGLMGANLDDIGLSMSSYIRLKYPDFAPQYAAVEADLSGCRSDRHRCGAGRAGLWCGAGGHAGTECAIRADVCGQVGLSRCQL
jgi:hypothetical protein